MAFPLSYQDRNSYPARYYYNSGAGNYAMRDSNTHDLTECGGAQMAVLADCSSSTSRPPRPRKGNQSRGSNGAPRTKMPRVALLSNTSAKGARARSEFLEPSVYLMREIYGGSITYPTHTRPGGNLAAIRQCRGRSSFQFRLPEACMGRNGLPW